MNSVIIVGAGISGLYAAFLLKKSIPTIDIKIIEASDRLGGRIFSKNEENLFFELGAEQIHGKNHILNELLEFLEIKVIPDSGDYYFFWKDKLIDEDHTYDIPPLKKVNLFLNYFEEYKGEEITLKDFLKNNHYLNTDNEAIFEGFAAEYGTDLNKLELKSLAEEEHLWAYGEKNYHLKEPMSKIIDFFKSELKENIILNTTVNQIEYNDNEVIINCNDSKTYTAQKCLVTVPLGVLKNDKIKFTPQLPEKHQEAIDKIGFDKGFKFLLHFSEKFWEKDTREIVGGQIAPVYLFSDQEEAIVCAYMMGNNAQIIEESSKAYIERLFIDELSIMFDRKDLALLLKKSVYHNWGDDANTLGNYSYPVPNSLILRKNLAEPIKDKLFFIGEACNSNGHAASVHGAMETAEQTCEILLKSYNHK